MSAESLEGTMVRHLRRCAAAFLCIMLIRGSAASAEAVTCEVRGVWLKPPATSSPGERKRALEKIQQAHLNTIFLISPPMKGNKAWSTAEEFEATLKEAKAMGLSVHVWITNHSRVPGGVNFTSAYEQKKQAQWATDLLDAYPDLDGVHLDYIRYMEWSEGNLLKTRGVSDTVRLTYKEVQAKHPGKFLTAAVFLSQPNYADFGREHIPRWFKSWVKDHPDSPYFDEGPGGENYVPQGLKYQQDAMGWLREGYIDAIMPMEYTMDDQVWGKDLDNWTALHDGDPAGILMGLGWLKEEEHPDWGYDAPGVVRKIRIGRKKGARGFVLFGLLSFDSRDQKLIDALAVPSTDNDFDPPFSGPVPSCLDGSGTSSPADR